MKLTVNGEEYEHGRDGRLPSLLEELDIEAQRVAIMVNGDVIPAQQRAGVNLSAGDKVEILTFAAGG